MSDYPQALPKEIAEKIRSMPKVPTVFGIAATPQGQPPLPMLIVVARYVNAYTWAKEKGALIGCKVMTAHTHNGSVLAVEVSLPMEDTVASYYTVFNSENAYDRLMFKLLQTSEVLGVGFGDFEGKLQGVKAVEWVYENRQMVAKFLAEARSHNAQARSTDTFDFDLAVGRFDALYNERLRQRRYH